MAPGAALRPSQDEGDGAITRSRAAEHLDAALLRLNQESGALDRERQEAAAERALLWGRAGRIEGALAALAGHRFSPTSRLMVSTYSPPVRCTSAAIRWAPTRPGRQQRGLGRGGLRLRDPHQPAHQLQRP